MQRANVSHLLSVDDRTDKFSIKLVEIGNTETRYKTHNGYLNYFHAWLMTSSLNGNNKGM